MKITTFAFLLAISTHASAAPQCAELFAQPLSARVAAQLAQLRANVDEAKAAGNATLARLLYADFTSKYRDAVRMGVDLSSFEFQKLRFDEVHAAIRENRIAVIKRFENPWREDQRIITNQFGERSDLSANGETLVDLSKDGWVTKRNLKTNQIENFVQPKIDQVLRAEISADGAFIYASGSHQTNATTLDYFVLVYDAKTKQLLKKFTSATFGFANDHRHLAIAGPKAVVIYNLLTNKAVGRIPDRGDYQIRSIQFSQDGSKVAIVGPEGLKIWALGQKTPLLRFGQPSARVALSRDFKKIAITKEGSVEIHDLDSALPPVILKAEPEEFKQLEFSSDANWLLALTFQGELSIYSSLDGARAPEFVALTNVNGVSMSGDGQSLSVRMETPSRAHQSVILRLTP